MANEFNKKFAADRFAIFGGEDIDRDTTSCIRCDAFIPNGELGAHRFDHQTVWLHFDALKNERARLHAALRGLNP